MEYVWNRLNMFESVAICFLSRSNRNLAHPTVRSREALPHLLFGGASASSAVVEKSQPVTNQWLTSDYGKSNVSTMVNRVRVGTAQATADLVGLLHQLLLRIKAATKYHWSVGYPTFKTRGNEWRVMQHMQLVLCFCTEPRQTLFNASNFRKLKWSLQITKY